MFIVDGGTIATLNIGIYNTLPASIDSLTVDGASRSPRRGVKYIMNACAAPQRLIEIQREPFSEEPCHANPDQVVPQVAPATAS